MSDKQLIPGLADYIGHEIPTQANPVNPTPQPVTVRNLTTNWVDPTSQQVQKTCPIYVEAKANGGYKFSAYITGSISDVDDYLDLIDCLLTATDKDEFYIYLDSPGGMISAGGAIASAIDICQAEVYAVVRGLCASAAALIMSSVKKGNIQVSPFAVVMFHMSAHSSAGFSTKIQEEAANQVKYVNEVLLAKAVEEGLITQEEFGKIQNAEEIFVTANEFRQKLGS